VNWAARAKYKVLNEKKVSKKKQNAFMDAYRMARKALEDEQQRKAEIPTLVSVEELPPPPDQS
jgi:hypothetical protein